MRASCAQYNLIIHKTLGKVFDRKLGNRLTMDAEDIRDNGTFEGGSDAASFNLSTYPRMFDLPYGFAKAGGLIITHKDKGRLAAILRHDADPAILLQITQIVALPIDLMFVSAQRFEAYLSAHFGQEDGPGDEPVAANVRTEKTEPANVTLLINAFINDALKQGASDIHVEAYDRGLIVRFRRDGKLYERLRLPPEYSEAVMGGLRDYAQMDRTSLYPQNGTISFQSDNIELSIAAAIFPNKHGRRMVLRIPDASNIDVPLDLPGMAADVQQRFRQILAGPSGMIIVAGSADSDAIATLYAALKLLNNGKRNIMTVEQAIAYNIDGISQMQVENSSPALNSEMLRSVLLQDPDVVMVSEIPDRKITEIALQAARTGPLILTALQAQDAMSVIGVLRERKVDRMLLGESLRCIIAQRLVKRLCSACRVPAQAAGNVASRLGFDRGTGIFEPHGCAECGHTGFAGTIGVFEVVCIDDTLRRLIISGGDEAVISSYAFMNNPNLSSAARKLVISGETTAAEAIRIGQRYPQ